MNKEKMAIVVSKTMVDSMTLNLREGNSTNKKMMAIFDNYTF